MCDHRYAGILCASKLLWAYEGRLTHEMRSTHEGRLTHQGRLTSRNRKVKVKKVECAIFRSINGLKVSEVPLGEAQCATSSF